METGTLITGIIAIGLCLLPFIFVRRHANKQKRLLQAQMQQLAGGKLAYFDQWQNRAIGIDQLNETLYFLHNANSQPKTMTLTLADVQQCRLHQPAKTKSALDGNPEKISLLFDMKREPKIQEWVFYERILDPVYDGIPLSLAKKWQERISSQL